jgi:hypothetical protein
MESLTDFRGAQVGSVMEAAGSLQIVSRKERRKWKAERKAELLEEATGETFRTMMHGERAWDVYRVLRPSEKSEDKALLQEARRRVEG